MQTDISCPSGFFYSSCQTVKETGVSYALGVATGYVELEEGLVGCKLLLHQALEQVQHAIERYMNIISVN